MVDELEPYWSGAMERTGEARGLSSYQGSSSLGEQGIEAPPKRLVDPANKRSLHPSLREDITRRLRTGQTLNDIALSVGVSRWAVQHVVDTWKKRLKAGEP